MLEDDKISVIPTPFPFRLSIRKKREEKKGILTLTKVNYSEKI